MVGREVRRAGIALGRAGGALGREGIVRIRETDEITSGSVNPSIPGKASEVSDFGIYPFFFSPIEIPRFRENQRR